MKEKIESETSEMEQAISHGSGATILLVEDDEIIRSLTRQMLEENGYRVLAASDGLSALNSIQSNSGHFDLVLTDVVMKGMSGPEMVRQLSQTRPDLKVIYMSGYTGELISEQDFSQPGMVLLEKPFTRSSLLKTVEQSLK